MSQTAWSAGGMICTAQPLASAAGLSVLQSGGNAVDATIAAALVLNVTMPMMCGLGGDVFAIIHEAKSGRTYGINASGAAPYAATLEYYRSLGYEQMPPDGMLSVAVPGGVRAYFDIVERFGTRSLGELAQAAIRYAEQGFVLTPKLVRHFIVAETKLRQYPTSARVYLPEGRAPRAGEILRQPDLARSFRQVVAEGPDALYSGSLGERVLAYANAHGGIWRGDEWRAQATDIYEPPLGVTYRDRYEVFQTAPPSQGLIVLEELNLVEGFELGRHTAGGAGTGAGDDGESGPGPEASAETVHILVEAKKLAFADRNRYAGDPRQVDWPLATLLGKEFAARRRGAIDPARAAGLVSGAELGGDTTSHVCVDAQGNYVSFIHSLSNAFGCCEIAGDTGILLNNRAGRGFALEAGHPNCIAPGKKTMHTLNTYLIKRDGRPYCVGNTPGGDGQPQWNLQVITNLLDLGMSVGEAAAAPRWQGTPGTDPAGLARPVELVVESRMGPAVRARLAEMGHAVRVVGPWAGGGDAQLIRVRDGGILEGASDPRGEGVAIGI
ncbi:MAG: gamma-glutamyltransferase family protein [Bacillota bacterium]|nr:gamma-glutamyltransferase family protein [Bacillota bacterium]